MKHLLSLAAALSLSLTTTAQSLRETSLFDNDWRFAFGHAASPEQDFGHGTEYFNYLTKANSIHNEGPYALKYDDSAWTTITLPHDWATALPYASEASHSHGYHTVGWKYPETSIGWYRKTFKMDENDRGKHVSLTFEGIFRNSSVWVNGFYLGGEQSGYATQTYDITDYLHYGDDKEATNLVTVRADASLEEGWFYEGAGIYRDVWLTKTAPLHVAHNGTFVRLAQQSTSAKKPTGPLEVAIDVTIDNDQALAAQCHVVHTLIDAEGHKVAQTRTTNTTLQPRQHTTLTTTLSVEQPHLWDIDDPYLYTLKSDIISDDKVIDTYSTTTGLRTLYFDNNEGLFLNGRHITLKGVNMHQDHAGVGTAIPPALQEYRLRRLKSMGVNAYRASHNPMTPAMLDACDRMGILVVEENRLTGINDYHQRQLTTMIERDRNHPSIILWSIGNEEWGLEWNEYGERISRTMTDITHLIDPSRLTTVATSSGPTITRGVDVAGYNYIVQNDIEGERQRFPQRIAYGSEETTACGSRGIYYDDRANGLMASINRTDTTYVNIIERGWKFYNERPWLLGCFYWTGFDYKGEPNPLKYPAVDSEFGILDYCGFEKDEAYYLRSWWTDEPVLHIFPHWNLEGHEGEEVEVWAYSNCDEVELYVNGKSLGRKPMERNGHLSWTATYRPGSLKAVGYKAGKRILTQTVATTGRPAALRLTADRTSITADGRDVSVIKVEVIDSKGRVVPTACCNIDITLGDNGKILGVGNGNPTFHGAQHPASPSERTFSIPTFNGLAQIILQADTTPGTINLHCKAAETTAATLSITAK